MRHRATGEIRLKVVMVEHQSLMHEALLRALRELEPQVRVVDANACLTVPGCAHASDELELVLLVRRAARDAVCATPAQSYAPELSVRQRQVLALLTQGKPNKLISRELGLAQGTVKIHVTAILKKLKVANRTQAALAARRLALMGQSDSRVSGDSAHSA
jgi:DNA-binding CsgD family transcriptional regulator